MDDDAPCADDLDLDAVNTRDDLAARLRKVHLLADKPSLRTLASVTRHEGTPLSKTVVADMLKGVRFPRKAVMVAFLKACEVQSGDLESWRRAWERVALREEGLARLRAAQASPGRQGQAAAAAQHPRPVVREVVRETEGKTRAPTADPDHLSAGSTASAVSVEMGQLREEVDRLTKANERLRSRLAVNPRQAEDDFRPDHTASSGEAGSLVRQPMWHFPDGSRVTLVSYRMPPDRRPQCADPGDPNYVRFADLADLDTLIDVYGAIRAYNPTSRVVILAAQDVKPSDITNHLVLLGGLTWEAVTPWFSRIFPIPIEPGDPFDRGAIVVHDPDSGERKFKCTLHRDEIVEDVGFFARGKNPSAPRRTLTICGGITTRGVHGAARCFIEWEMRQRNEQYLISRFPAESTYCIVMRVPIVNKGPLALDLSNRENRLFEWCDTRTEAE